MTNQTTNLSPRAAPIGADQVAAELRTDDRATPIGVSSTPKFSWRVARGEAQTAFRLQVARDDHFAGLLWDTGQRASAQPFGVTYEGSELESATPYFWRVQTWSDMGAEPGPWSDASTFQTAVLEPSEWSAAWVGGGEVDVSGRPLYLRTRVDFPAAVVRATAHVSALGWYRFFVNGQNLTGDALVPRWTPLDDVVEYQTYDVTQVLGEGDNILTMVVGDGRFRGTLGYRSTREVYGDKVAAFVQIRVELADGQVITTGTDDLWMAGAGRITRSDPKLGEDVDDRIDDRWWYDDAAPPIGAARPVSVLEQHRRLIPEQVEQVRTVQELSPVRVWRTHTGRQVADFGQNFAGITRARVSGASGTRVTMTHSEVITADQELDTEWILQGKKPWYQRDEIILSGGTTEFQPWFTVHGFRYVEIDGLDHDLTAEDITGLVISTDVETTGAFECSDERLNQLFSNVMWSTRSNFNDTATDCPTRERSGWTGDIQVFAPTAMCLIDAKAFLARYLDNVIIEQLPDGRIPPIIPSEQSQHAGRNRLWDMLATAVGWGDVVTFTPWDIYQHHGDLGILQTMYPSMRKWVEQCERRARTKKGINRLLSRNRVGAHERYILDSGYHWGEWLRPGEAFPGVLVDNLRNRAVVATAYFARSAQILSRVAEVLGRDADAQRYAVLAADVAAAWRAAFVHKDGTLGTDRQDDYVRAIAFDLLLPEQIAPATARLVELIETAGDHLGTGFLSTPMLLPVLAAQGRSDVAYRLLMQDTSPSWLGQVARGATTVWETWDGHNDDGRPHESHNHFALGSAARWLFTGVVGLQATSPGHRTVTIDPTIGGGLTHAQASLATPYGVLSAGWVLDEGTVRVDVDIPVGVTAVVNAPTPRQVGAGTHSFTFARSDAA